MEVARKGFHFDAGIEGGGFGESVGGVANESVAEAFVEAGIRRVKMRIGEAEVGFAEDGGGLRGIGGDSGQVGGLNAL